MFMMQAKYYLRYLCYPNTLINVCSVNIKQTSDKVYIHTFTSLSLAKHIFSSKSAKASVGFSVFSVSSAPLVPILKFLILSCQSCFVFIEAGLLLEFLASQLFYIIPVTDSKYAKCLVELTVRSLQHKMTKAK